MIQLGVNIDHVATLRQVRGTVYPDPVRAALLAEEAGADLITLHLREDRRHIQEGDVDKLRGLLNTRMNLELAVTDEMLVIAQRIKPQDVCLVPERRQELTTEGGLNVLDGFERIYRMCSQLEEAGCRVSLFIDPDFEQIQAAYKTGVRIIELHTGAYADAEGALAIHELTRIQLAAKYANSLGLRVNAGHGLHYENVKAVALIPEIAELNIGHAIVAEAVFLGWQAAVRRMKDILLSVRSN